MYQRCIRRIISRHNFNYVIKIYFFIHIFIKKPDSLNTVVVSKALTIMYTSYTYYYTKCI